MCAILRTGIYFSASCSYNTGIITTCSVTDIEWYIVIVIF